jgi:hypothetical protein
MLTRTPLILIVALTAALIAAGCGDDDEDTTTTTATTEEAGATGGTGATGPQSEFAQQADEICAEGDKEIDAEAQEFFGNAQQEPPQAEQERFAEEVVIPNVEQQIEDVAALPPPEGQEEQFDEFVDEARSAIDEVKADPSLVTSQGSDDPFAETNQMAKELGLQVCGQS